MKRFLPTLGIVLVLCAPADSGLLLTGAGSSGGVSVPETTLLLSNFTPAANTNTIFGAVYGSSLFNGNTGAITTAQVPIPLAGTLGGVSWQLPGALSGASVFAALNGSTPSAAGCTNASGASGCLGTTTAAVSAGDLLAYVLTPNGTWTASLSQVSSWFKATDGKSAWIGNAPNNFTSFINGPIFFSLGAAFAQESAAATVEIPAPIGFTATVIAANPNDNDSTGAGHSYYLVKNGTAVSAFTCATNSTAKCIATPASVHFNGPAAVGGSDTYAVESICGTIASPQTNCAVINPGISIAYIPDVPGQSMLVSTTGNPTTTPSYVGPSDANNPGAAGLQYQMLPNVGATLIGVTFCSSASLTGSMQRTAQPQWATAPGTAPNVTSAPVTAISSSTTCPSTRFSGGAQASLSLTLGPGYTLWTDLTAQNSPGSGNLRVSYAVSVP